MSAIGDKPNQLVVHGMLGSAAYFDVKDLPTSSTTQTQIDAAISNLATVARTGKYADLTDVPTTFPPAAHSHPISDVTGLQSALDAKVASVAAHGLYPDVDKTKLSGIETGAQKNVATNLGNSTTAVLVNITSSTGTNTTVPAVTTTAAGVMSAADKTKLNGIATGATANDTNANLLARANHTGTQTWATISNPPTTATRWPSLAEVTGTPTHYPTTWASVASKPTIFPTNWANITGIPTTATRWPSYTEVTGTPSAATATELRTGTQTAVRDFAPKIFYDAAAFIALTSAATITPNLNSANNFTLTLAHNATLANPTGAKSGQSGTIYITHTGTNTLSFGDNWEFIGGVPELGDGTNADVITYQVVSASKILASFGSVE